MRVTRGWIDVDLDAIVRNARAMQSRAQQLLPMLKADAYGLGAIPVARALEVLDPWGYGVATIDEGTELRNAGIARRIMLFTAVSLDELEAVRDARLIPALSSAAAIARWTAIQGGTWHLGIDTGMSRSGVRWSDVAALAPVLRAHLPEGAYTHFHSAELDDGSVAEQERRFERALALLPAMPAVLHAENSAILARRPRARWPLVRPGVFLYGVGSGASAELQPEPVVAMRARIVELRTIGAGDTVSYDATYHAAGDRRIATVAVGYADGYRRALGNRAQAIVRGARANVAGIVTMDMTMLDVTGIDASVGDVVTLIGRDKAHSIGLETLAAQAVASPYELLTGLHARLPRVYHGGPPP